GADPLSIGSRHSNSAYVFMVTPEALSTNGIAIFEGRVSGGAPQLSQANVTNFETFTLGRFTGRARGTLGPKP
ncbi:hypothetical protein EBZ02_08535, partial [bacterium]|nr:hypothetical protein [bacterium]